MRMAIARGGLASLLLLGLSQAAPAQVTISTGNPYAGASAVTIGRGGVALSPSGYVNQYPGFASPYQPGYAPAYGTVYPGGYTTYSRGYQGIVAPGYYPTGTVYTSPAPGSQYVVTPGGRGGYPASYYPSGYGPGYTYPGQVYPYQGRILRVGPFRLRSF